MKLQSVGVFTVALTPLSGVGARFEQSRCVRFAFLSAGESADSPPGVSPSPQKKKKSDL